jgi:hypothetical protein
MDTLQLEAGGEVIELRPLDRRGVGYEESQQQQCQNCSRL